MEYKYKVTIGMPVYGVEKYIEKCMHSILNQTFNDEFEILVIDDRGQDRSIDIVKDLQTSHPRGNNIRILTQPKNMGCWAARNRILEEAQGYYIFFIDSDDYISEDCIEKLYKEAVKYDADAVYGSVTTVDDKGNYIDHGQKCLNQPYMFFQGENDLARFAYKNLHPTFRDFIWNTLYKREFIVEHQLTFKQAKFNEDLMFSADLIPLIKTAVLIPDHTYFYVIRENSLSNYQFRSTIKLEEIIESFRVFSYIKNKCKELRNKDYFEIRCTKGLILMFYAVCGALKKKERITPILTNKIVREAMRHPLQLHEILKFKKYLLLNLVFYMIGILPPSLSVYVIKIIGKRKHYI